MHGHGHHHGHHGHDHHSHSHAHGHHHAPPDSSRAFAVGIALNLGFVGVEAAAGLLAGSMALLADAGHNLSDVLGLVIAWGGATLAKRPPSPRFTYGLGGSSILAALANAVLLLAASGAIAWEAVRRFADPPPVPGTTVMIVAAVGILVNGGTALLFAWGNESDINRRGAYLHMLADAAVSAAVVAAGLAIWLTGALWLDPLASLLVVGVILWSTWGLLKEALAMAMAGVPRGIDPARVEQTLAALPGVGAVHDLHIWPMSTTDVALTAHLVMPAGHPGDAFLHDLQHRLAHDFGIGHATVQVETGESDCQLEPPGRV